MYSIGVLIIFFVVLKTNANLCKSQLQQLLIVIHTVLLLAVSSFPTNIFIVIIHKVIFHNQIINLIVC